MCGSFFIDKNDPGMRAIADRLALPDMDGRIRGGAVSPQDTALVLEWENEKLRPLPMAWGFPLWQTEGVLSETPAESIHKEPLLRNCLLSRPVAVPTSGFFVRRAAVGADEPERFLLREPGGSILYLAGFAGTFPIRNGRAPDLFVLLTVPANESAAPYGERMPLAISRGEVETWLSGGGLHLFLQRTPLPLVRIPFPLQKCVPHF